jgi:hypothetical protein
MWHTAEQHLPNEVIRAQTRISHTGISHINTIYNSYCNWKFILESYSDFVLLCFICSQKHISRTAIIVLNLKTSAIKFTSIPNRKELDLNHTTLCYLNLAIVLNPVVITIKHSWVTYKTEEWKKVTTVVSNTNTLARLKTFTFYELHKNFNFPHSNIMLFTLILRANTPIKNDHWHKINFSKIMLGHYCILQLLVATSCQPV